MSIDIVRTAVLTALASGPQHGYGILRDIQELSGGKVSPPVGSLYRAIDNLFRDGLIEEDRNEVVDGRFRRYYRLTVDGRDELAGAAATMQAVAARSTHGTAAARRVGRRRWNIRTRFTTGACSVPTTRSGR